MFLNNQNNNIIPAKIYFLHKKIKVCLHVVTKYGVESGENTYYKYRECLFTYCNNIKSKNRRRRIHRNELKYSTSYGL